MFGKSCLVRHQPGGRRPRASITRRSISCALWSRSRSCARSCAAILAAIGAASSSVIMLPSAFLRKYPHLAQGRPGWHVALVVPAPWGQRRRATRWQSLATATRWQSLETRASQNVQHCSTLTHNDIGRARWQSQAHRQPAARLRQLRCRPPQALPGRSSPPSALHRPSHGACLRRHHPRPPGWLVVLVVPAPRGQRR